MAQAATEAARLLFPFDRPRPIQDQLIDDMRDAVVSKSGMLAHAPTGLGKTVASIAPCLRHALDNDLTVFFLTSRHTQHQIVVNTLRKIREKFSLDFRTADLIGKKWMCAQPGVAALYAGEFYEYCKAVREEGRCQFYTNARTSGSKLTNEGKLVLSELEAQGPSHVEELVKLCKEREVCPYEIASALAAKARVVVTDYFYLFHPTIRESFFKRTGKSLDKAIIIVDEGHNLPERLRELMSSRINSFTVRRAVKEAKKHGYKHAIPLLTSVQDRLNSLSERMRPGDERKLSRDDIVKAFGSEEEYRAAADGLTLVADHILKEQKKSAVSSVAGFLEAWAGTEDGYARILASREEKGMQFSAATYRCLDPGLMTSDVVKQAYAVIVMSGTLTPLDMYRDLLGMDKALIKSYPSPFPKENRLALVSATATTQYKARSPAQYARIAEVCAGIANRVPGNSAAFFPSYALLAEVNSRFERLCEKTVFMERQRMTKEEKAGMFERFSSYSKTGAVLLGVTSGSFSEGIDFIGDLLKAVVIVGLPLQRPDMETNCLIEYYDRKFRRGWDYGYVFPAMNRVLQGAGRCIRSDTDRGAIVFLDSRYSWPQYLKCLPKDEWDIRITTKPEECFSLVEGFFKADALAKVKK